MKASEIPFRYGTGEITVHCPRQNILAVIMPGAMPDGQNEIGMIRDALRKPLGTKRLTELAKPGDSVAIVTDDHARPAVGFKIVPQVLAELESAGVRDEDITIIMGSGTHRPCTKPECEHLLGRDVVARYNVVNHNMDDKNNLVYIGMTSRGNAVWINKRVAHAKIKILTGQIGIISLGFSGGRKSVLPAVCGRNTIYFNHRHEWVSQAKFGNIEDNVMHEDALEAAHLAKVDFIVNVVLNLKHEVIKAVAGDLVEAWMAGVQVARKLYTVPLDRHPEIVVVSGGGSPSDDTLYQALKGYQVSFPLMKQGGAIILVAECKDGVGDADLERYLKMGSPELLRRVGQGEHVHFMADMLSLALEKASVLYIKSSLPAALVKEFGLVPVPSVEEGLTQALSNLGNDATILCLPKGSHVAPVCNGPLPSA